MYVNDFESYIREHATQKITVGRSGANVYELDHTHIAKHVRRDRMQSDGDWDSYQREAQFYLSYASEEYPFLPKIYHCSCTDDEIRLIMEKYLPIDRNRLDDAMLEKVFSSLAQIHSMPVPGFLPQSDEGALYLSEEDIDQYVNGWLGVIREHDNAFSEDDLVMIGKNINTINKLVYSPKKMCCHGDFHFDNLLTDYNGNIIVCDWQNVNKGHPSGDISFFLSRLSADGFDIDKERAIEAYCRFSDGITHDEISMQMSLANLNVSFIFWHNYLHSSSTDHVRGIWNKMTADAKYLLKKI